MSKGAVENTDTVIWRRDCDDFFDKKFSPRVFITASGALGISDGDRAVTMSVESWVELGWLHLTAGLSDER